MTPFIEGYPLSSNRAASALPFSEWIDDVVLPADTIYRHPIPSFARYVVFSISGDFRAKLGISTTPLVSPVGTTDGSGSELNPAARRIPDKLADGTTTPTHIIMRSAATCTGSLSFYG